MVVVCAHANHQTMEGRVAAISPFDVAHISMATNCVTVRVHARSTEASYIVNTTTGLSTPSSVARVPAPRSGSIAGSALGHSC